MKISRILKDCGLKATMPRLAILSLFYDVKKTKGRHLTADEVYIELQPNNQKISLGTVYRVLEKFEAEGLLIRHHFEGGKACYELNEGEHHDHLVCLDCGLVQEFCDPDIEKRQKEIAKSHGVELADHDLYLYFSCNTQKCQNKK